MAADALRIHLCDGKDITNCIHVNTIISLLKFYHNNNTNYEEINKYLEMYKANLLSDFHHILDVHLNEEQLSAIDGNRNFQFIHQELNDILCNIGNCQIYARGNRQRESMNTDCTDKNLSMYIDIIDTIHCYFIHSVDVGYRIINLSNESNSDHKTDEANDILACDSSMKDLKSYLSVKCRKLKELRGDSRINHSKFMTHTSSFVKFYIFILDITLIVFTYINR